MIEGAFNQYREAALDLTLRGPTGYEERLEFIVDTGFDGALLVHSSVAAALDLPPLGSERAMLADGSITEFTVSEALLLWDGMLRALPVHVADSVSHLGMQVLDGHELRIHAVPNGIVQITPLAEPLDKQAA